MRTGRSEEELAELKAQATRLRLAGIGGRRIAKELAIPTGLVTDLLRDVPVAAALSRPNARDATRQAAEALRVQGLTYDEIATELAVSKSSLSLWLRDLPHPTGKQRAATNQPRGELVAAPSDRRGTARVLRSAGWLLREIAEELGVSAVQVHRWTHDLPIPARATHGQSPQQLRARTRQTWDRKLAADDAQRAEALEAAAARVPAVTDELLDLLAAVTYWCEGTKRKPWNRKESLSLINSDADVILLWLAWLRRRGVEDGRIRLRLAIHESADLLAATAFWADIVGRPADDFSRPTLKRHNPRTVRKNVGEQYHGCLVVTVLQSRLLYREIEGSWRGIVRQLVPERRATGA